MILKDLGIIGGAGPEAGALLIKKLIHLSQHKYFCKRDEDFPFIALFSFPFVEMLKIENKDKVASQLEVLIREECSQTKIWAIACNTLHCYLDKIKLPQNIFVNMLEETANCIVSKPVVFCSSTSRLNAIHANYFACDYPSQSLQLAIDHLIDDLNANHPTLETFKKFIELAGQFKEKPLVLGCTEFSLLHHYFPIEGNIIDPLLIVAEKMCALHFKVNEKSNIT